MLGLYVLVFGFIFEGKLNEDADIETRFEYAIAIFMGLAIHHFLAEILTISPTAILTNPNFIKKVVFPTSILPTAIVGTALIHFGISLLLILIGILSAGLSVSLTTIWWLPIILLPLIATAIGLSFALSALAVFWRDILQITPFLSLALLFSSAVFYPVADIPAPAWVVLKFNPLVHWIEEVRKIVFWRELPNLTHIAYIYIIGALTLIGGLCVFHRLRKYFADIL